MRALHSLHTATRTLLLCARQGSQRNVGPAEGRAAGQSIDIHTGTDATQVSLSRCLAPGIPQSMCVCACRWSRRMCMSSNTRVFSHLGMGHKSHIRLQLETVQLW